MADITLVELNLQGAESTIHLPFSGSVTKGASEAGDTEGEKTDEDIAESASSGPPTGKLAVLVGLAFLLVIAALAKRRLGDDDGGDSLDFDADESGDDVVTVSEEE